MVFKISMTDSGGMFSNGVPSMGLRMLMGTTFAPISLSAKAKSQRSPRVSPMPMIPPAPPPGRNLSWRGGSSANAWDITTTTNWIISSNSAAATFTNGDNVTFDDAGSNTFPISLNAAVTPGSVTVAAAKNYYFNGGNPLLGAMALNKSGSGTLFIGNSNAFGGGTTISGGMILLTNDNANICGLGSGPVTLVNATLTMHPDFNTYNSSTWNLVVPAGATGTLNADSRCDLYGTLTGGGTFNLRIPDIRTTIFANWSAFTGVINALASGSGGKDFRIGPDYAWAGLAVTGTFVNNGRLDLLTGAQTLPANFINNGMVLLATNIVVSSAAQSGGTFTLTIQGYDGHTYQLQRSATMKGASWQNIGPAQDGVDAVLTFTDTAGGNQNFYRILVSP